MKKYRYTRPLDGAPEGTVRKLNADEAAPLLKSGAIEEADDADETEAAPAEPAEPIEPITHASMAANAKAVKPARGATKHN